MTDQRCENCRFFREIYVDDHPVFIDPNYEPEDEIDPVSREERNGECHFDAPSPIPGHDCSCTWPEVIANEWCGKWENEHGQNSGGLLRIAAIEKQAQVQIEREIRAMERIRGATDAGAVKLSDAIPPHGGMTYKNTGVPGTLTDMEVINEHV